MGDIAALVKRLKAVAPDYIVVEASGGFESGVVTALATSGLPVCRVSPLRVRSFARAVVNLYFAEADRPAPIAGVSFNDTDFCKRSIICHV